MHTIPVQVLVALSLIHLQKERKKMKLNDALDDVHQESGKLMDRRSDPPDEGGI